jgi:choline kinase
MAQQTIHAVILAAGRGNRLGRDDIPKALLGVGGRSLLVRHIRALARLGVTRLDIVVGFAAASVLEEILPHVEDMALRLVPVAWQGRESLCSLNAADIGASPADILLLMDADLLYEPEILERLIRSDSGNAALVDFDAGDDAEAVKLCVSRDCIVDFGKFPAILGERWGESVGIFKLDRSARRELAATAGMMLRTRGPGTPHEDALREMLLDTRHDFRAVDITGLAWVEIDFPEDFRRACDEIMPRIDARSADRQSWAPPAPPPFTAFPAAPKETP